MSDGFSFFSWNKKGTDPQPVIIHETFLVLRFLSIGIAILLSVSLFVYIRTLLWDGPLMLFAPSEERQRLPGALENQEGARSRVKVALMREQ